METEKEKGRTECCLVFATHRLTDGVAEYLAYLKREAAGVADLLVLYDCAAAPVRAEDWPWLEFHVFDSRRLEGFFHCGERRLPNPLLALLDCAAARPYAHYLLMENDVVLAGDFNRFLRTVCGEASVDYIHIATDADGGRQRHWPVRLIRDNPFGALYFSWSQLFRVSRRYLKALSAFIRRNGSFYYEFLLPTLAYNGGFTVRQFENYGYRFEVSWGPAELYEQKYLHDRRPDTFYHPIKHLGIVDFLSGSSGGF